MARNEELVDTLRRFNLFADLDRAQLEAIADPQSERSFAAGERILRRGMSGSGFYVILEGEAAIRINGETRAVLTRGDFFGEVSAVFPKRPRNATVRASESVRALRVRGDQIRRLFEGDMGVRYALLVAIGQRGK